MNALLKKTILANFFSKLEMRKKGILLLDYDGTLAPFKKKRQDAVMHPKIAQELQQLAHAPNTKIIIISGRTIQDLLPLVSLKPLPEIWGCHGLERRTEKGKYSRSTITLSQSKGLALAKMITAQLFSDQLYEDKFFSIVIHLRGLRFTKKQHIIQSIEKPWEKIAKQHDLEIIPAKDAYEIRVRGKNKGTAVATIISKLSRRDVVAYIGDDKTDEDAFFALGKRGLKVIVGENLRKTGADIVIKTHSGVAAFLHEWNKRIGGM